jgi:hypothetical protein
MADTLRPRLRLRPNEHRFLLLLGDLIASVSATLLAYYVWQQFSLYNLIADLVARGIKPERAEDIARNNLAINVPFWFYLLPLAWLFLMVELYEPHTASN